MQLRKKFLKVPAWKLRVSDRFFATI